MGVQHVWSVAGTLGEKLRGRRPRDVRSLVASFAPTGSQIAAIGKGADAWLSLRSFETPGECVAALRAENWTIWVAADDEDALSLASSRRPNDVGGDRKLAIVIGRESDGICAEFAEAAERRVCLPLGGFTTSLNLSVATALIVQRLFDWFPHFRGDLSPDEKAALRLSWRDHLAKNTTARERLAPWIEHPELVPTHATAHYGDARVSSGSWAPRRVREREAAVLESATPPAQQQTG
ncbi:hypothetical protein CTAYLR_000749 [Chrysophaeum taylorii]|uniref:tRNA/rRNA methyltransferase SpoU type domain-containing protein n=1 Tax=Chrysophaeum taylorii TaxID=2483200 RepID=A0AAD7UQW5_9STRA|nr:hypothetical protein CTAYLR_000749 [Chrysophaeum taylorii]